MDIFFFFFFWGGGGGHDKIGLVLGVSSMYFRVFSYGKCTVRIFLRGKNFKYFFVCLIFPIFSGGKR